MNYVFPIIRSINDVLPAIEGFPELKVTHKEGYSVINYQLATDAVFHMSGLNDVMGALRRECRGLIFDDSGMLISRPFHKFFNYGEREETLPINVDFTQPYAIMEKIDGSMIRPLFINQQLVFGTKMGITDIANDALLWLNNQPDRDIKQQWLIDQTLMGNTPLFEWVSNRNRVVIDYQKDNLTLLGIRDNLFGTYITPRFAPFDIVAQYGLGENSIEQYIAKAIKKTGREGDIIRFDNGHMIKIKNEWYVAIHKMKEKIVFEKDILELILSNGIDDIIPFLTENDFLRIKHIEDILSSGLKNAAFRLGNAIYIAKTKFEGNKKRIALELVPTLVEGDAKFVFAAVNGKTDDISDMIYKYAQKGTNSMKDYEIFMKWLQSTN